MDEENRKPENVELFTEWAARIGEQVQDAVFALGKSISDIVTPIAPHLIVVADALFPHVAAWKRLPRHARMRLYIKFSRECKTDEMGAEFDEWLSNHGIKPCVSELT